MSGGYRSPALEVQRQSREQAELEIERRRQPRQDWTDLKFEEFQKLSGAQRNHLYRSDQAKYTEMSGRPV